ncbi:hypothetical protein ACTXT7_016503 [Hymenolepis weldensis]
MNENNREELVATGKREEHYQRSADSSPGRPEFVSRVHGIAWHVMMNKNRAKSMRDLLPKIFERLKEQQYIRNVVHQDLGYKSCRTQENHLMRAKQLVKKLKQPEEEECLWFFFDQKNCSRMEKSIEEMIDGWLYAEVPNVMHAHEVSSSSQWRGREHTMSPQFFLQGLRVNADADAYVETLQTIVVKSSWIDSAANGGRPHPPPPPPHIFQQDSAPSHKALKTQDWMDDEELLSSCHTKLMPTPSPTRP